MVHTWLASSLVGEMITPLKPWLAGCCSWASSGRQKAKVFPDPVGAQASSSRPWQTNQTKSETLRKIIVCALITNQRNEDERACLHASWGASPASVSALGNWARRLWGSEGHAGWGDTRTAAPRMCTQGQVCHSRAHLCGFGREYDWPRIKEKYLFRWRIGGQQ